VNLPLAGKRDAARRLAGDVWRWFGLTGSPATPGQPASASGGEDAAARIDAARERLRSTIAAPDDEPAE
jgi:hypothetical protein